MDAKCLCRFIIFDFANFIPCTVTWELTCSSSESFSRACDCTYSRLQYLKNTITVDYHNQLLHDCVIQQGLIHMALVITLQQFCDSFPFAQFVSYEKGFKPCEKLPLCLLFLCCLNQGKLGHRKIWMKHSEGVGCQGVPVTWGWGEKSQHAGGERGFTWR